MARFLHGQSGNPGGRPKNQGKAAQLAREHAAHAIFALVRISCDMQATRKMQLDAARELLRQGFGRTSRTRQEESGYPGGGIGRFPDLRSQIEDLVEQLDRRHAQYRQVLLLELSQLEQQEGLTRRQDAPSHVPNGGTVIDADDPDLAPPK